MNVVWGTLLFLGKWLLIGLIYLALFEVFRAVRREMGQHLQPASSPAVAPGRLRVVNAGSDPRLDGGQLIPLASEVVLGAEADRLGPHDLLVQDLYVSGRHARLSWDGVRWWVEDLGSTNGTFVDEQRIAPQDRVLLPVGGTLRVGDATFELLE